MQAQTHDSLRTRLEQLRRLRDEVRLRIHLGSLDAKATFEKLVPRLDEIERQLAHGSDVAVEDMTRVLDSLRAGLMDLHAKLSKKSGA